MWKNVHPVYGAGIRTHDILGIFMCDLRAVRLKDGWPSKKDCSNHHPVRAEEEKPNQENFFNFLHHLKASPSLKWTERLITIEAILKKIMQYVLTIRFKCGPLFVFFVLFKQTIKSYCILVSGRNQTHNISLMKLLHYPQKQTLIHCLQWHLLNQHSST